MKILIQTNETPSCAKRFSFYKNTKKKKKKKKRYADSATYQHSEISLAMGQFRLYRFLLLQYTSFATRDQNWAKIVSHKPSGDQIAKLVEISVFLAHLNRRLIGELIVYEGTRRPSVVNIFKRLLL